MNNQVLTNAHNKCIFSPSTKTVLQDNEAKEYKVNNRLAKRLIKKTYSSLKKRIIYITKDNLVFQEIE